MTETTAAGRRASWITRLSPAGDRPPVAAALMVMALIMLSLQDAIIKATSSDMSIWQFQFLRSTFNLILLFAFVAVTGAGRLLPPRRLWTVVLRSTCLVGAMLCFFSGVPFLSLAEIAAGLYLFPLIVTLLSRFVLSEQVGWRRFTAVGVGFTGSLLILKPGSADFQVVSLLPVCAGFFYAMMVLTTRRLCRNESPLTLALGVALAFMSVGIVGLATMPAPSSYPAAEGSWPYLLTGWHELAPLIWLAVIACSCLNLTSNIFLARAYQSAESSWLAPFDYSYLVFAMMWGYILWGTVPDVATLAGIALISGSGIYVAIRSAVHRSRPDATAET